MQARMRNISNTRIQITICNSHNLYYVKSPQEAENAELDAFLVFAFWFACSFFRLVFKACRCPIGYRHRSLQQLKFQL